MDNNYTVGTVMITQEQIYKRAEQIGAQITQDFQGEAVLVVGILKGAVLWMADVIKHIHLDDVSIDFMACSSYGASTKSSGVVRILKDLDNSIEGKNVIIVEDIVDSGITLNYLKQYLEGRHPKSIKVCSLLDKPEGRRTELEADYVGFTVEDKFIVGYGLDYDQKYRNLPYISYLEG
ncbi:hypoxanthine phosphoribosyltransferase [Clostridium aminobutyricum]|uniref:Hypoxanthine phosphoribosyltransferase n=1 Tax=Clostridium aminobutyricum TaxID=33953 RepID=A0A939IJZ4_CLOAM|nr:hypoxanthine phosphoribosyltransferase [Clostridium aminobutyricum]MBN7774611.1 hypoxanthine phosphoribosyltransferase [Clostridium aminobutyricum]